MHLKEFSYELPEHLIAQNPLPERDQARLMVIDRKQRRIRHERFSQIGQYLPRESLLVLNNSKVVPARLLGTKLRSGGKVEIFLLKKRRDSVSYEVLLRPKAKIKTGDRVVFNGNTLIAEVKDKERGIVAFNRKDVLPYLETVGHIPLPPYIKRRDTAVDREFYQTVYARYPGSVAAPTAGLHFTETLLHQLKSEGHQFAKVTLHINYATFMPVQEEDIRNHRMQQEEYSLSLKVRQQVRTAQETGQKIVAVGTTACRVLETVSRTKRLKGKTDLFIYPGFSFRSVDALVTNFHLPFSSLLMLVYAFGSRELMQQAYREAIQRKYRFYSYGDAMLIL